MIRDRSRLALMIGALAMAGCLPVSNGRQPARLSSDAGTQMEQLKAGLSGAVGRAKIELGAGDPLGEGTVVVLPPRPTDFETHSLATPVTFDLELRGETCFAVSRDTGEAFALPGVECMPRE